MMESALPEQRGWMMSWQGGSQQIAATAGALVGMTFLGGSTQLVVTWILEVTGSPMAIAWYLTAISLIGFAAMYALKESAPLKHAAFARRAGAVAD